MEEKYQDRIRPYFKHISWKDNYELTASNHKDLHLQSSNEFPIITHDSESNQLNNNAGNLKKLLVYFLSVFSSMY